MNDLTLRAALLVVCREWLRIVGSDESGPLNCPRCELVAICGVACWHALYSSTIWVSASFTQAARSDRWQLC